MKRIRVSLLAWITIASIGVAVAAWRATGSNSDRFERLLFLNGLVVLVAGAPLLFFPKWFGDKESRSRGLGVVLVVAGAIAVFGPEHLAWLKRERHFDTGAITAALSWPGHERVQLILHRSSNDVSAFTVQKELKDAFEAAEWAMAGVGGTSNMGEPDASQKDLVGLRWNRCPAPRPREQTGLSPAAYDALLANRKEWDTRLRQALTLTRERFEIRDLPGVCTGDNALGQLVIGPMSGEYPK